MTKPEIKRRRGLELIAKALSLIYGPFNYNFDSRYERLDWHIERDYNSRNAEFYCLAEAIECELRGL